MIQVNKVTTSCLERSPTIVIFLSNSSAGRKNPLWLCIRIVSAKVVIENFPPDFNGHLFVGSVLFSILCTLGMRIFKVFEQLEVFCVSRSFKQLTSCFTTSRLISGDTRVYFCFCPLRPFPLRLFFPCPCLLQLPGFFSFFFRPFRPSKKIVIIGKTWKDSLFNLFSRPQRCLPQAAGEGSCCLTMILIKGNSLNDGGRIKNKNKRNRGFAVL